MIISVLKTVYNVIKFISLMKNIFYMYKNIHYKVYLLNRKLNKILYKDINNEKDDEE